MVDSQAVRTITGLDLTFDSLLRLSCESSVLRRFDVTSSSFDSYISFPLLHTFYALSALFIFSAGFHSIGARNRPPLSGKIHREERKTKCVVTL